MAIVQDMRFATRLGRALKWNVNNDNVVSLSIISHDTNLKKNGTNGKDSKSEMKAKEKFILSVTENGYGKRTSHYFREKFRQQRK